MAKLDKKMRQAAVKAMTRIVGPRSTTIVTLTAAYAPDDYDESSGDVTGTPPTYSVRSSPILSYEDRYVDGDNIRVGDSFIVVAELDLEAVSGSTGLAKGWTVTEDATSEIWHVVGVRTVKSGEQVAVRKVQLRR